jgi:hypothetical protein
MKAHAMKLAFRILVCGATLSFFATSMLQKNLPQYFKEESSLFSAIDTSPLQNWPDHVAR